ncbi:MAG TPA: hypothetical protein VGI52_01865 [Solirubrobacteraceae bacterium]
MSLVPVPSEQTGSTCAHCGAALVADQRYCLSCGQPASPVRLAFLDVLQSDPATGLAQPTLEMTPAGYVPVDDPRGANGWLRRNSGLLSLLSVLVLCLIVGLLVGHWAGQGNKTPAKQVVEIKGLSGLAAAPAAAATAPTSTTGTEATETSTKATAKEEAEAKKAEAKETKAEKAPPPAPKKVAPTKIKKLTNSSGAQHQKEINELGAAPIETG